MRSPPFYVVIHVCALIDSAALIILLHGDQDSEYIEKAQQTVLDAARKQHALDLAEKERLLRIYEVRINDSTILPKRDLNSVLFRVYRTVLDSH